MNADTKPNIDVALLLIAETSEQIRVRKLSPVALADEAVFVESACWTARLRSAPL